jgi:hypothetical protein
MAWVNGVVSIREIAERAKLYGARDLVFAPGWETRSNGSDWAPGGPKGFVDHHTAGGNNIYLDQNLINGVPGLSGPLCNYAGLYDGDLAIVSAGPANHAGASGGWDTAPLPNTGWFNREVLGIEMQYKGTEPMSPEQWRTLIAVNRAAQEVCGWDPSGICIKNHQGTSIQGKWDMGNGNGTTYPIEDVRKAIRAVGVAPAPVPVEDDMANVSDGEKKEILDGIRQLSQAWDTEDGKKWIAEMIATIYNRVCVPQVSYVDQRAGKPADASYRNDLGGYVREADVKLEDQARINKSTDVRLSAMEKKMDAILKAVQK